jgi:hypothetical protein
MSTQASKLFLLEDVEDVGRASGTTRTGSTIGRVALENLPSTPLTEELRRLPWRARAAGLMRTWPRFETSNLMPPTGAPEQTVVGVARCAWAVGGGAR